MKALWHHVEMWWFQVVSVLVLIAIFLFILVRQQKIQDFKMRSQMQTFIVDLDDNAGWQPMQEIQTGLQNKTQQPVYNELVDRKRNIYEIKVFAPPEKNQYIWSWLKGLQRVEHVNGRQ